jgi:hypothetical protein
MTNDDLQFGFLRDGAAAFRLANQKRTSKVEPANSHKLAARFSDRLKVAV